MSGIFDGAIFDPLIFDTDAGAGTQNLTATLFVNASTFGAHTVTPGAVSLAATLYADPDTFGSQTISQAGAPQTLTATLFADADAFGSHTIAPGPVTLTATLYADPDAFGAHTISQGAVTQNLTATLYVDPDTFGSHTISVAGGEAAPIQGGWGTYDTREDERRQRRLERDRRAEEQKRRKAVEQAFRALDVQPETVAQPIAPRVKAEIRAVALPKIDMAGIGASLDRLDAMIEALWAEQQAELARVMAAEAEQWRQQEEEALIALLMVA
jgi:hypothetical protein